MSELQRFVARWSRLKREPATGPAHLPPLETLAADADLSAYLRPDVEASLRRRALQRLFSEPAFNVMDGLDVYIDDYSIADPIPAEMLAQMNQTRILWDDEAAVEPEAASPVGEQTAKNAGDAAPVSASTDEDRLEEENSG